MPAQRGKQFKKPLQRVTLLITVSTVVLLFL